MRWNDVVLFNYTLLSTLHEKPYFPGPRISWKAQKDQVNITFPSTFCLKRWPYCPSPKSSKQELFKAQNKNFSVIIFSSTLRLKKYFPSPESSKQELSSTVISKYHLSINFLAQKRPYIPSPENSKQQLSSNQLIWHFILKKISSYRFFENWKIIYLGP